MSEMVIAAVAVASLLGGALFTAGMLFARVKTLEQQLAELKRQIEHLETKIDTLLARSMHHALEG